MKHFLASLLIAESFVAFLAAQPPKPLARISGRVIAAATGRPLARAIVTLRAVGTPPVQRTVRTDVNGNYQVADLPAGRYSFMATRAGYLDQNFDQPNPLARFRLLELAEGEQLVVNFSLQRGAAITGIITDEAGEALTNVQVLALREQYSFAGRRFIQEMRNVREIVTDDEGRYRVYGLRPGTYVVAATAPVMWSDLEFARTYYPGTLHESEAQTLSLDIGLDGVANFSMIPAKRARVSGIVRDSHGRPASGWSWMVHEVRGPVISPFGGDNLKEDGSFEIERVLPGDYLLQIRPRYVRGQVAQPDAESAIVPLTVSGEDISGLTITTSAGYVVTGRVVFDGAAAAPVIKGLSVSARQMGVAVQQPYVPPSPENGLVDAENRFRIVGVRGKTRVFGGGGGWFTKRVLLRGQDVTASGFDVISDTGGVEVVLTNRVTTVTGSARDARGIARNDFIVAFFPTGDFDGQDRASRQRTIRPDPDGVYRVRNLPPGDYLAAAVPTMTLPLEGEWDPAFFERVKPRATRFTLEQGQTFTLNLTVIE